MGNLLITLLILNAISYAFMWIDKMKAIYKWWRVSEKTLWILAGIGGVFGIWLGMQAPLYHKAGKREFRFWIPVIAFIWVGILIYFIK